MPTSTQLRPTDLGKPRMRGWLHAYAFGVAVVAGIVLSAMAASRPGFAGVVTLAIYRGPVRARRMYPIMLPLDHSMIFVFIAGTYTPFAVLLLNRADATMILAVVWGG